MSDSDLYITSPAYGKDVPKKCRLSPDGWFQMALQLTYYRMYHKLVLTYESATTRYPHTHTHTLLMYFIVFVCVCADFIIREGLRPYVLYQCSLKLLLRSVEEEILSCV